MRKINIIVLFFVIFSLLISTHTKTVKAACINGATNNTVEPPEQCDMPSNADTASCDYDNGYGEQACTFASCGDGYLNFASGETCDDGPNNGQPAGFLFTDWSERIAGTQTSYSINAVDVSGNYAFTIANGDMVIMNISNPTNPTFVATHITPGNAQGIYVQGNFAYIADYTNGLRIVDISNPASPQTRSNIATPGDAIDVVVSGNFAYVADLTAMQIIDVANPNAPILRGRFDDNRPANDIVGVAVNGNRAYIVNGYQRMTSINITNPDFPTQVGFYYDNGYMNDIFVYNNTVFIASNYQLEIIDVTTNESNPIRIGLLNGGINDVVVNNNIAYVAAGNDGMKIIDVSNTSNPRLMGVVDTTGYTVDLVVKNNYAYIAAETGGLVIIDISPTYQPILSNHIASPGYHEIAVANNRLYVAEGNGSTSYLKIFNISDPINPIPLNPYPAYPNYNMLGSTSGLKVVGDYLYSASMYYGLQVYRISDPTNIVRVSQCDDNFGALPYCGGLANEIDVVDNYAYIANGVGGFDIVDITNPENVQWVSHIPFGNALGVTVSGNYAYVSNYYNGGNNLNVVNITNKSAPFLQGTISVSSVSSGIKYLNDFIFLGDRFRGMAVINVSNKSAPTLSSYIYTPEASNKLVIYGNYSFIANINSMQVINISNPLNPSFSADYYNTGVQDSIVDLAINQDYIYLVGNTGLDVVRIRDSSVPNYCNATCSDITLGICGNALVEPGEECDDGNFNDSSCTSMYGTACNYCSDGTDGNLACTTQTSNGPGCGDGVLTTPFETCDDGNATNAGTCNATCLGPTICGDGTQQTPNGVGLTEICDDGNTTNNGTCNATCTAFTVCGDNIVQTPNGVGTFEACDEGETTNAGLCNAFCTAYTICGDGTIQNPNGIGILETCDDGNATNAGICNASCTGPTTCGDGTLQTPNGAGLTEICDDGNTTNNGTCNATCTALTVCGDGITQTPNGLGINEICDDGNTTNNGTCNATCTAFTVCGDNIVQTPNGVGVNEVCDDGNTTDNGTCNATCTGPTICGDSVLQTPNGSGQIEECDPPGSPTPLGGICSTQCRGAVCGNNFVDLGEGCDEWISDTDPNNDDTITCNWNNSNAPYACTSNTCGDGYINETNEVCDQTATNPFRGSTCASLTAGDPIPRTSGNLTCTTCSAIDTNDCYSCGNGIIEGPEYCDDGNTVNGDGCANNCFAPFTPGWSCGTNPTFDGDGTPPESLCALLCGNGNIDAGEACDDNNNITETVNNCTYGVPSCTFCNNDCSQILNFVAPYCGNNSVDTINAGADGIYGNNDDNEEACDLGASLNNNPNCSYGLTSCNTCLTNCSVSQPGITSYCGDGIYDPANEDCEYDTGAPGTSGDGCSSSCTVETGYACGNFGPGGAYTCSFHCGADANGDGNNIDVNFDINGDGIIDINEQCDNGNLNGIRCIADTYGLNCNWCTNSCETRTVTGAYCGDGQINQPYEACDQGNTTSGDGCSATCQIENGWQCSGTRDSRCNTISGDGVCVGAPYESCQNNFNDCGSCFANSILAALPGQGGNALNNLLKSITDIFPAPILRINIPGLNFGQARVNEPLEVEIEINGFGQKTFFIGDEEINMSVSEFEPLSELINVILQ